MKYSIHISALKTIDDWHPKTGAQGNYRVVDSWDATIESDSTPTRQIFNDKTFDRYGIGVNSFRYWPDEPGRFTANRIEDDDGYESKHGRYLADYDVRIECRPIQKLVNVGHFGLKSVDE